MTKFNDTKKKPVIYKSLRKVVSIFYRKRTIENKELLSKKPAIYVSNHAQIHGPLSNEMYFPNKKYIWCIGEVMKTKSAAKYNYQDFWSQKPIFIRWFFKLFSYVSAPLSAYVFSRADTIPVYKDKRIATTFKDSIRALEKGCDIIIFPESREKYNNIVNEFQTGYIDLAKIYYKKYNECLDFIPVYNAPKLKKIVIGKPITYNPEENLDIQKQEITNYLKTEITELAKNQPLHKVVPYDNVGRKNYQYNK
jgi:hypothetical protein